jgi:hypothetical protein
MIRHALSALSIAILLAHGPHARAQQAEPVSIEVFPFELEDKSAGAGLIPPDDYDRRYLLEATQMTRHMLSNTGNFRVVETSGSDQRKPEHENLRYCGGCELAMARQHGASLALLGVITRVNRTEHTMFIRIMDANTGKPVAVGFTDLRMGANHAWPRTARWLMTKRILKQPQASSR